MGETTNEHIEVYSLSWSIKSFFVEQETKARRLFHSYGSQDYQTYRCKEQHFFVDFFISGSAPPFQHCHQDPPRGEGGAGRREHVRGSSETICQRMVPSQGFSSGVDVRKLLCPRDNPPSPRPRRTAERIVDNSEFGMHHGRRVPIRRRSKRRNQLAAAMIIRRASASVWVACVGARGQAAGV